MYLRHHPLGERGGWRKMWQLLEGERHLASLVHLCLTLEALANMGTQRRDAEADVAVNEKIDFVRE
jgi:hypothetical protein